MDILAVELKETLQSVAHQSDRGNISHELSVINDDAVITKTILPIKNLAGRNITVWTLGLGGVYTHKIIEPELKMIQNGYVGFNYMFASGVLVLTISS